MSTLWEDAKRAGARVVQAAEQRSGKRVVDAGHLARVEQGAVDARVFAKELEYVGWTILNHTAGQSFELRPESRRHLAAKSLNAYLSDPQGGRIVEHYVAFVLGRGVPKPQAKDPDVQTVIDDTWKDPSNQRQLTSQEAIVRKARSYAIQANLYLLYFDDGGDGAVRMSSAQFHTVDDVYRHPEERARILYYVAREKRRRWNPSTHREEDADNNEARVVYYEAVDAFHDDDPVEAEQDVGLWQPPDSLVKPGKLLHLSQNNTDEMAFGVPGFRRLLRWLTAYNEVLESYVERMKAAARLYMKANVTGGKSAVERAGLMAVRRAGGYGMPEPVEGFGADDPGTRFGDSAYSESAMARPGAGPIPGAGRMGIVAGNESLNYEPFKIDSGAGDVAGAAPIMRGMVAAGGGWPGWYFGGDPGSVAGSQSLELPVTKFVELEQEIWAKPFRHLADRAIARHVELGLLDEWRPPTEQEQHAIQSGDYAGETDGRGRVKRDLSYEFNLPDPVKRAMGDLVAAATQAAVMVDPNGDFPLLSRWLFTFVLREAFEIPDPQKIVDEVMPLERIREMEAQRREQAALGLEGQRAGLEQSQAQLDALASSTGQDGQQHPPDNPAGAVRRSPNPEQRTQQARLDRARARMRDMGPGFDEFEDAALAQAAGLAHTNGGTRTET